NCVSYGRSGNKRSVRFIDAGQCYIPCESRYSDRGTKNPIIAAEFPAMRAARIEQVISNLILRRTVLLNRPEKRTACRAQRDHQPAVRCGESGWKDLARIPGARTRVEIDAIHGRLAAGAEPELVYQPWREHLRHTQNQRVRVNTIMIAVRHIQVFHRLVARGRSVVDPGKEIRVLGKGVIDADSVASLLIQARGSRRVECEAWKFGERSIGQRKDRQEPRERSGSILPGRQTPNDHMAS